MKSKQEIQLLEGSAGRVLHLIQECINELRGFKTLLRSKHGVSSENGEERNNERELFFQRLSMITAKVRQLGNDLQESVPDASSVWGYTNAEACGELLGQEYQSDWNRVVAGILFPLINNLGRCYSVFDAMPTTNVERKSNGRDGRKNKPPAPPGMLSIQQYMDIGVLLECTVVMSIIPMMDPNILQPLEARLKMIPKSLLGRTPLLALREAGSARINENLNTPQRARELLLASTLIGNLVHLDRFRPMLLPRHLADIYAAYFQSEQILDDEKFKASLSQNVAAQHLSNVLLDKGANTPLSHSSLQAQAFQSLLLQGRQSPVWLRRRVSALLNNLATMSLQAVVVVFLHSATGDKTAASARLARALITGTQDAKYAHRLSLQLFSLLDSCRTVSADESFTPTEDDVVTIQFVWMVFDLLPESIIDQAFYNQFCAPFLANDSLATGRELGPAPSIHLTIRRVNKLLSSAPSTVNRSRFCRLVLLRPLHVVPDIQGIDINLLGMLIRLACTSVVFKSIAKSESQFALRSAVDFVVEASFQVKNGDIEGVDMLVVSLCYSLTLTRWDSAGLRFEINSVGTQSPSSLEDVKPMRDEASVLDVETTISTFQKYAEFTTRTILAPCWQEFTETKSQPRCTKVPSRMLEYLLFFFLRGEGKIRQMSDTCTSFPSDLTLLTAMIELPHLCELCPMEALLSESAEKFRLLRLTRIVFGVLAANLDDEEEVDRTLNFEESLYNLRGVEKLEVIAGLIDGSELPDMSWLKVVGSSDFSASLAKILLNLLACMLELGSPQRSKEEEQEIKSLSPYLRALASVGAPGRTTVDRGEYAELGDAASHVLTLIAMRCGTSKDYHTEGESNSTETLLRQAESDLSSAEPPLRARGVWTLKNIIMSRDLLAERSPMISILDRGAETPDGGPVNTVLLLLLRALSDSESYVYLAAVHGLAALCSSMPEIFPLIVGGLMRSSIALESNKHILSADQRVKLAEVAITVIRRSAEARRNATLILDLLLYGGPSTEEEVLGKADSTEIDSKTLLFFEGGHQLSTAGEADEWEEKKMRLNTGGPLFDVEELDVVRSAMMNLGSEVISLVDPIVSARYCEALVDCASSPLSLQSTGRPIRRSGAALAATLYQQIVKEMDAVLEPPSGIQQASCPMTIAMIKAGEERLGNLLHRSLESETDAGTIARCKEALAYRDQAESGGILAAGHISVDRGRKDNPFLVQLLESDG